MLTEPAQLFPQSHASSTWTPRFTGLFAAVALAGCGVVFLGVSGVVSPPLGHDVPAVYLATLTMYAGLAAVCLLGLWSTQNRLLRAGLLLQVGVAACASAIVLLNIRALSARPYVSYDFSLATALTSLGGVLNLSSLICLSYGVAPWQASDRLALPLQLLLTVALGSAAVVALNAIFTSTDQSPFEVVCSVAAVLAILARPACWKARPLIALCLVAGGLTPLAYLIFLLHLASHFKFC